MFLNNSLHFAIKEFIVIIFSIIVGILFLQSPLLAVAFLFVAVVGMVCGQNILSALSVLIFLTPYSATELFNKKFLPVPGAKPYILLALFTLVIAFIHSHKAQKMPLYARTFAVGVIAILTISVFRSFFNFDMIMPHLEQESLTLTNYFLSHYLKAFFYFMPFILIIKFAVDRDAIESIIKIFTVSLFCLSLFLLVMYALKCPNKTSFYATREFFQTFMGLHTNSIGTFYSIAFPLLLARNYVKKSPFNLLNILLCLFVVGILYSRTAYVLVLMSFFLFLLFSRKLGNLPIVILAIGMILLMLPGTVKERAGTGLASKDASAISAGRIDGIWLPVLKDYLQEPIKLLIGNGKYSLVTTDAYKRGYVAIEKSAHSLYFEQIFDSGLIGLSVTLALFFSLMSNIFKNLKFFESAGPYPKEYLYAALISLINYLFAGFTGQSIYPELPNTYLWGILGLSVAIIQANENLRKLKHAQA